MTRIYKMIYIAVFVTAFVIAHATGAHAAVLREEYVAAYDMAGHEVMFDDDGHTENAGPVRFVFDTELLSDGEMYLSETGSTFDPVEDGEYTLYPESGISGVRFYLKEGDGSLTGLCKGKLSVSFTEEDSREPEAYVAESDEGYVIHVKPLIYSHVFVKVKGGKNGFEDEIKSDTEVSVCEDGIYDIAVYSEDGLGHRTYADIESRLMLDRKPPVLYETEPGVMVSKEDMSFSFKASDEVSGVEGIYVKAGDAEPVRADSIELRAPSRGKVEYWAVDNAGNISEKVCLGEDIMVDDKAPALKIHAGSVSEDRIMLYATAEDDLSGTETIEVYDGSRRIYAGEGDEARLAVELSALSYGDHIYKATACDRAGNRASGSFTLTKKDGIAPVIRLSGADDRGVYGESVEIRVSVSDDSAERCEASETVTEYSLAGEYRGETVAHAERLTFDKSGVYILRVEASDSEGNISRKSIGFSIDREAPEINGMEGLEGSDLKSFMMEKTGDLVTDDSPVNYDIMLNGVRYDGGEINESGRYRLKIYAVDELGNTATKDIGFNIKK